MEAKHFSINRFNKVVKYQLYHYLPKSLVMFGAYMAIMLFIAFLNFISGNGLSENYFSPLFIIGFSLTPIAIAGSAFNELRDKKMATLYLTLPASSFEKFLATWLYTLIIGIVGFFVTFFVANLLGLLIGKILNQPVILYNFFGQEYFNTFLWIYFIQHSMFFLGATIFKRSPIFYTLLWQFIITYGGSIILGLIFKSVVYPDIANWDFSSYNAIKDLEMKLKISFYVVLSLMTILFWAASYFKVKEKQVL